MTRPRSLLRDMSGNIAMVGALAAPPLAIGIGAAADWSRSEGVRRHLQAALDNAVLAGAVDNSETWTVISGRYFDRQFDASETTGVTRTFSRLPNGDFQGVASADARVMFAGLLWRPTLTVSATAVSRRPAGASPPPPPATATPPADICPANPVNTACILALAPNEDSALRFNSNSTLNAPNCQVHTRSNHNAALMFNAGASLTAQRTCVRGTARWNAAQPASANYEGNCNAFDNPYSNRIIAPPFPGCTRNNMAINASSGGAPTNLPAGGYCGDINFNGNQNIVLGPGVHFFRNGRLNVNGGSTITANNAVMYFEDANSWIRMNGQIRFTQTPPQTGNWAGVAMFEPDGLSRSQYVFNTGNGQNIRGIVYLPSRDIQFNANSETNVEDGRWIGRTFTFDAMTRFNLRPYTGPDAVTPSTPTPASPPAGPFPASMAAAAANELGDDLIVNGSFETVTGQRTQYFYQGSLRNAITAWSGAPDWEVHDAGQPAIAGYGMTTMARAAGGSRYGEIDARAGVDVLSQSVQGTAGAIYQLSFSYAAKIADGDTWATNQFDVYWNGQFIARIYPTDTANWTQAVYRVVGRAGTNTLEFRELPCTDNDRGGLIDLVSLRPILAPQTAGAGARYPYLVR